MKKLLIGLVAGLLIGSASTVAANEYIQARFATYNMLVNGVEIELESDPLVYQDSTYLPVRYFLNTFGYDVTYLAESRTIVAEKSVERFLADIEALMPEPEEPQEGEDGVSAEQFLVSGVKYKSLEQTEGAIKQLQTVTIKFYKFLAEGGAPTEEARLEAVQLLAAAEADLAKLQEIRELFLNQPEPTPELAE